LDLAVDGVADAEPLFGPDWTSEKRYARYNETLFHACNKESGQTNTSLEDEMEDWDPVRSLSHIQYDSPFQDDIAATVAEVRQGITAMLQLGLRCSKRPNFAQIHHRFRVVHAKNLAHDSHLLFNIFELLIEQLRIFRIQFKAAIVGDSHVTTTEQQHAAWTNHLEAIVDLHAQLSTSYQVQSCQAGELRDQAADVPATSDCKVNIFSHLQTMPTLRGGADDFSDMDAEREAALTGLPAILDSVSSDNIPAWIVYDKRSSSLPPQRKSYKAPVTRCSSTPILPGELHRTLGMASKVAEVDSDHHSTASLPQPPRVHEWLSAQPADASSTSPPPVPSDLGPLPDSPEQEGEELTAEDAALLNERFQGTLRGGAGP
jgi:hypothetical protein